MLSPDAAQDELQVAAIDITDHTDEEMSITSFLQADPASTQLMSLEEEQRKDSSLVEVIRFLEEGVLPEDETRARKLALQGDLYTIVGSTLYHLDAKRALQKQVVWFHTTYVGGLWRRFIVVLCLRTSPDTDSSTLVVGGHV